MKMKLRRFRSKQTHKSQSLVELAIVLPILILLMSGVVEFGNLLNQYINLVDGAREGARFGSDKDPFVRPADGSAFLANADFYNGIDTIVEGTFSGGTQLTKGAISPISLNKDNGDDVVISVFSILNGTVKRFPYPTGWSKYSEQTSKFTDAELAARLDATAPDTGMLLVEIFYNYSQILKMPFFTAVIPDPISVHTYSIMPLTAAEPTPTPKP